MRGRGQARPYGRGAKRRAVVSGRPLRPPGGPVAWVRHPRRAGTSPAPTAGERNVERLCRGGPCGRPADQSRGYVIRAGRGQAPPLRPGSETSSRLCRGGPCGRPAEQSRRYVIRAGREQAPPLTSSLLCRGGPCGRPAEQSHGYVIRAGQTSPALPFYGFESAGPRRRTSVSIASGRRSRRALPRVT